MKAKDLRERTTADLVQLRDQVGRELFSYRMKNCMGQLEDTSLISKTRRDVARIEEILTVRGSESPASGSES